jgi:uncharacterized membrane protein
MEILNNILLWIHLMALVAGGAGSVAMPAIAAQMGTAPPDARPVLGAVQRRIVMVGRAAVAVLLVTGPLMFWLKWDFTAPSMTWFGIKMLFVLLLLVGLIVGGMNMKKAAQGDAGARTLMMRMGMLTSASLLIIVLAAVFAFN